MKKATLDGSVVVYRDEETKQTCGAIITHVTGRQKKKYYRVAMNGLGMIMDWIDEDLRIPAFNRNLRASFNSLEEILECTNKKHREEALYALIYYVQHTSDSDKRLSQVLKDRKLTKEDIAARFAEGTKEEQLLLVNEGVMNLAKPEEAALFLKDIEDEELLHKFIQSKNNRAYFFNTYRSDFEKKIDTVIKNEEYKKSDKAKLISLAWEAMGENPEYVDYMADNFEGFSTKNKAMFLYCLEGTLANISRSEDENKDEKLSYIVSKLKGSEGFKNFVSDNIGDYFESLSGDRDYNLGKYFDLPHFVNLNNFRTELLGAVDIEEMLRSDAITGEIIEYIWDNRLYEGRYSDGSPATDNNVSNIASHKNTPSRVLEEIVRQDKTYLSGDSYGKWDVVSALSNENIDPDFLTKVLAEGADRAKVYGCLSNKNLDRKIYNQLKERFGKEFVYETSGWDMVHTFA